MTVPGLFTQAGKKKEVGLASGKTVPVSLLLGEGVVGGHRHLRTPTYSTEGQKGSTWREEKRLGRDTRDFPGPNFPEGGILSTT